MSEYSDQEINLRPYLEALLSKWIWILGLGLLAGIVAFVATSLFVAPTYQATALVSIVEPRQRVQFDPRIITVEDEQPLRAYPELAKSDELLLRVKNETAVGEQFTVQQLRAMFEASLGNDPSLIRLTASNTDPEVASELANAWGRLFVSWAKETYGDSGKEQLLFFEQRLEDAAADMEAAENALIEYQAQNRTLILENELQALQQIHANLLAKEGEIEILSTDIESILALTPNQVPNDRLITNDQVTALILKLRAFAGSALGNNASPPFQLQVSADMVANENQLPPEEQVLNLQAILQLQSEQTNASLEDIEPQILAVQLEKQEAVTTESLLVRKAELARDTHTALARTVEEKRITSQDTNTGVTLASRSTVPASPIGPRKSFNALAAFTGIVLILTFIIILLTWWRLSDNAVSVEDANPNTLQNINPKHG